jgi:hypothetical protein
MFVPPRLIVVLAPPPLNCFPPSAKSPPIRDAPVPLFRRFLGDSLILIIDLSMSLLDAVIIETAPSPSLLSIPPITAADIQSRNRRRLLITARRREFFNLEHSSLATRIANEAPEHRCGADQSSKLRIRASAGCSFAGQ